MRIMLVEDSKTMRNIQKNVLAKLGYDDVVEACDGQDALSKVDAFNPDLLLVDWNMPNMDGLELLGQLKSNPQWKDIPVIMITTEGGQAKVMEAVQLGAAGYVRKPFTADQIKDKLTGVL